MNFQDWDALSFSDDVSHYLTLSGASERSTRIAGDLLWTTAEGREEHLVHVPGTGGWDFPAWSSEMIPGNTEMLLSSPPPNPAHLQHHQTSWSKKSKFF